MIYFSTPTPTPRQSKTSLTDLPKNKILFCIKPSPWFPFQLVSTLSCALNFSTANSHLTLLVHERACLITYNRATAHQLLKTAGILVAFYIRWAIPNEKKSNGQTRRVARWIPLVGFFYDHEPMLIHCDWAKREVLLLLLLLPLMTMMSLWCMHLLHPFRSSIDNSATTLHYRTSSGACHRVALSARWLPIASARPPMKKTIRETEKRRQVGSQPFFLINPFSTIWKMFWRTFGMGFSSDDPIVGVWSRTWSQSCWTWANLVASFSFHVFNSASNWSCFSDNCCTWIAMVARMLLRNFLQRTWFDKIELTRWLTKRKVIKSQSL